MEKWRLGLEACEVKGGEFWESCEEVREGWINDSERESKSVGDGEELFGDKGERLQIAVVVTIVIYAVIVDEEFKDRFPTVIR
ncbi:hypothetical protein L195_g062009 [Trifolium pratense]|uniref:Uncharacterized protein n=1 Tax=Trifolium pratense TaxID=57577 RepID=A0A2K3KD61_TRIPR|nr:hypothetical protein L195_g062009 [Trifolium pratense]